MIDGAADARALQLFEALTDQPTRRAELLAQEPPSVLTALAALEGAAPQARLSFPTEGDVRPPSSPPRLPERIGAYRLSEPLGEGGMAVVFAAERADGLFDHSVAIKLIHPDRFTDRALERFGEERRLLARLNHPGIARLIDGGVAPDGWPYIIMERIDGTPIDAAAGALSTISQRVELVMQVCDAVSAAHAAHVVHGDIKPGNLLVEAGRRVRLLDFGIARLISGPGAGADRAWPMTAAFASPARRGGAPPTTADDVYSLGILLRLILNGGDVQAHRSSLDRDLAAIADRACAEDAEARYPTVDAMAKDLEHWRQRRPITARPRSVRYVAARFYARHQRSALAASGAVVLIALLSLFAATGWQAANRGAAVTAARTADVQQLARFQLFTLSAQLEHQPRSVALRRDLAAEAGAILARAAAVPDASQTLRQDAANGYRLLAAVEGAPDRPSLGRPERAAAALDRARSLLAADPTPAGRHALAQTLIDYSRLANAAGKPERSLTMLGRAWRLAGDAPLELRDDIRLAEADTMIWNGNYADALAVAGAVALRARGPRAEPAAALRWDRTLDRLAEANFYHGDEPAAERLYRQAVDALESASQRWPADVTIRWALARQRWNLGTTLLSLARPTEALALLERARATFGRIVADDPDDAVATRRLRIYEMANGQALAAVGRVDDAVSLIEANIAARRRWAALSPVDTSRVRDLTIALAALGDIHAAAGQRSAACGRYAEARALRAKLARQGHLARLDAGYFENLVEASERKLGCAATA